MSILTYKQETILEYAGKYGLGVLIETGTYRGETVEALLGSFKRIFSIELGQELADAAKEKFKGFGHVNIVQGDSGALLESVLKVVQEPALIWLDAHYSGGDTALGEGTTPVADEMKAITGHADPRSVVLIDDARDFTPEKGHPPLEQFVEAVREACPEHRVWVENDIIRIVPCRT